LDWAEPFDRPAAKLLIDRPTKPQAADPDACLGCHDGSVADSRRSVWVEHGHRVGQKPTDKVTVPADMPLEDGKMTCRTCHSAHAPGRGVPDFTNIVFVRMPKGGGELCAQCHPQKAEPPEKGTHPLGAMPFALPDKLKHEGARSGGHEQKNLTCQTCHMAHGPRADHLLVLGTESSQLCLACHEKLRPTMWHEAAEREHPPNPPLTTAAQKKTIKDLGTRTGPGDTLICLSCHRMHHGQSGRYMLAAPAEQSKLCISCHPDRQRVVGSPHDLRKTRPDDKNRLNQTPQQAGPCGSCHSFHRYARQPTPSDHDPNGLCTTCHKVGADKHSVTFAHPTALAAGAVPKDNTLALHHRKDDPTRLSMRCSTCHDPHETDRRQFLRIQGDALCANCHGQKVKGLAGKHDFAASADLRNAQGHNAAQVGKCGFCHAVHEATGPAMWIATRSTPQTPDDLCLQCHREGGLATNKPATKLRHPTGPSARPATRPADPDIVLFSKEGHKSPDGFVACGSCHDIHGDSTRLRAMLRSSGPTSQLCVKCHADQGRLRGGQHDALANKEWGTLKDRGEDLCASCHKAHSNDLAKGLWTVAPAWARSGTDARCVACHPGHAASGAGPIAPGAMLHPTAVAQSHGLPLVKPAGAAASMGCATCHDPHASAAKARLLRVKDGDAPAHLCLRCHAGARPLDHSMHAPDALKENRKESPTCGPCHAVHAVGDSQRRRLWAWKVDQRLADTDDALCLGCHDGKSARRPTMPEHPIEPLRATKTGPATRAAPIRCATCHVPHGDSALAAGAPLPLDRRRATKSILRPDVARQACSPCHGPSALPLHLYWHQPDKRARVPMPGQK
jgi:predicted CXXCH cytochrome family protein